jgi:hypothetical protein
VSVTVFVEEAVSVCDAKVFKVEEAIRIMFSDELDESGA